jgi:hypothetical protein
MQAHERAVCMRRAPPPLTSKLHHHTREFLRGGHCTGCGHARVSWVGEKVDVEGLRSISLTV